MLLDLKRILPLLFMLMLFDSQSNAQSNDNDYINPKTGFRIGGVISENISTGWFTHESENTWLTSQKDLSKTCLLTNFGVDAYWRFANRAAINFGMIRQQKGYGSDIELNFTNTQYKGKENVISAAVPININLYLSDFTNSDIYWIAGITPEFRLWNRSFNKVYDLDEGNLTRKQTSQLPIDTNQIQTMFQTGFGFEAKASAFIDLRIETTFQMDILKREENFSFDSRYWFAGIEFGIYYRK